MTKRKVETVETTWEVWTYQDVWGNKQDGYYINDRSCIARNLVLDVPTAVNNVGSPHEFKSACPTDQQIREVLWIRPRVRLSLDGDDLAIYVEDESTGYPFGELLCTSHESLSPIRVRARE